MVGSSSPSLSTLLSSTESSESSQIPVKRISYNFLQKLHLREIGGTFQKYRYGPRLKLFNDIPTRLQFSLEHLAPISCLYDGHIFLGFTKDGHFILSYTSQMEVDLPFSNPTYVYKLYYWRFIPNMPLKKISEIHLFKEFEILSELLISICQWPSDDSKILIHGFCPLGDQEHRTPQNQCYLTIAAVPPVYPCEECKASYIDSSPDDEEWDTHQSTCLFHGFVLHVQYHLVPPFPHFIPKVSLKKDGSVVLNTGDSLIALTISTEVKNDLVTGGHASEVLLDSSSSEAGSHIEVDTYSSACVSPSTTNEATDSESGSLNSSNCVLGLGNLYDDSNNIGSQISEALKCKPICKTGTNQYDEHVASQSSSISSDSRFSSDFDSTSATSSSVFELFTSPGRRSKHKFYSKLELKDEGKSEPLCDSKPHDQSNEVTVSEKDSPESAECSGSCTENCASPARSCKPSLLNIRGVSDGSCALRTYSRLPSSDEKNLKFGYNESLKENMSPEMEMKGYQNRAIENLAKLTSDYAYLSPSFPRSSSPENGISTSQTTSCITSASRVFVPHVDTNLSDENEEEEELGNSAYQNSLSFEVYWPSATRLLPCPTSLLQAVTGPVLAVKQTAFDVEPYLHETAQRLCNEAGQKYQAFTDYDIQIVDVFAETGDVLILVVMLVQATPKNKGHAKYLRSMCGIVRKQYETGFTFLWNIQTGKYQVVDTESLKEIDIVKGKYMIPRPWNPGRKKCGLLQEKWLLPCTPKQDVQVLTNKPVLTGVPLEKFCPLTGDVAIVRFKN